MDKVSNFVELKKTNKNSIEQIKILGEQIGVEVYAEEGNKNPLNIALNGVSHDSLHLMQY